jgi:FkbM family methyltransferase
VRRSKGTRLYFRAHWHSVDPGIRREANLFAWIRRYRLVRPLTVRDRVHFFSACVRAALAGWLNPSTQPSVGHYLTAPIVVRPFKLRMEVRPQSDDLLFSMEDHKPSLVRWFRPRPGEFVVDVGAHVGLYSLWAAQQGAAVLAIEPNPNTYGRLLDNIRANGPLSVDARNVAVGARKGEGTLFDPGAASGVSSLVAGWARQYGRESGKSIRVPVVPLDVILPNPPGRSVDWLLIDAEGSEAKILEGGPDTLARTRQIIIEVASGETERRCEELLQASGFRINLRERQNAVNTYWFASR